MRTSSQGQYIGIKVAPGFLKGGRIGSKDSADAFDLIRRDGFTDACGTNNDAKGGLSTIFIGNDGLSCRHGELWMIVAVINSGAT